MHINIPKPGPRVIIEIILYSILGKSLASIILYYFILIGIKYSSYVVSIIAEVAT